MFKDTVKRSAFGAARLLGAVALARRLLRRRLRVLCYHGVVDDSAPAAFRYRNTVTRSEFVQQMRGLAQRDRPVDLASVVSWARGDSELPDRAVLVTFDDGYRNNLTHAAPILREFRIPAVVAVSTAMIAVRDLLWPTEVELRIADGEWDALTLPGTDELVPRPSDAQGRSAAADRIRHRLKALDDTARRSWIEDLRRRSRLDRDRIDGELVDFLDWDEVRALRGFGIAIASHTVSHPILSKLAPESLATELRDSKGQIERELGEPCEAIVYPNGKPSDVSRAVFETAARCGYRAGFDLDDHVNPIRCHEPFRIRRLEVPAKVSHAMFEARASGLYAILRRRVAR